MEPISIGGAWTFTPAVHRDDRGDFLEWFRAGELSESLGYWPETAQANCSVSRRGVIRGIHFAERPPGQAKYVTCVSGAVLDVVVDVRVGSPSYGRWEAVRLDDAEPACRVSLRRARACLHRSQRRGDRHLPVLDPVLARTRARRAPPRPGHRHRVATGYRTRAFGEGRRGADPGPGAPRRAAPRSTRTARPTWAACARRRMRVRSSAGPATRAAAAAAARPASGKGATAARCRQSPIGRTPGPGSRPRRGDPARCRRAAARAGAARCSVIGRTRAGSAPSRPKTSRASPNQVVCPLLVAW